MGHDPPALHVAEEVDHRPHRPLHRGRRRERQEPQCRPHHLAPARVAPRPALHAHRNHLPPLILLLLSLPYRWLSQHHTSVMVAALSTRDHDIYIPADTRHVWRLSGRRWTPVVPWQRSSLRLDKTNASSPRVEFHGTHGSF